MGGSKCSSIANSSGASGANLPRCGCSLPMKLWLSNTGLNPNRKFWKCRNIGLDGCDLLVWDDELDEVEAANPKQRSATNCRNCELMKEFGREFGREIWKKFSQFVIGVIMMCVVLFAMLLKSM